MCDSWSEFSFERVLMLCCHVIERGVFIIFKCFRYSSRFLPSEFGVEQAVAKLWARRRARRTYVQIHRLLWIRSVSELKNQVDDITLCSDWFIMCATRNGTREARNIKVRLQRWSNNLSHGFLRETCGFRYLLTTLKSVLSLKHYAYHRRLNHIIWQLLHRTYVRTFVCRLSRQTRYHRRGFKR